MVQKSDEDKSDLGKLTIVLQAAAPGIWPGPYQIDIHKLDEPADSEPVATRSKSVLGNPDSFSLPAGTYQIVVSHPEEETAGSEAAVAPEQETLTTVSLGHPLARGYRRLMLETRGRETEFEAFLLNLGNDPELQSGFGEDPDGTLRNLGVLVEGERLSRNNRLFIALLANESLRQLIRIGPAKTLVPDEYRNMHRDRMRRFAAKVLPPDRYTDDKVIDRAIQERFYFQSVIEASLTDPVIQRIYRLRIDKEEIHELFDMLYRLVDDPDLSEVMEVPGSAAMLRAGVPGGIGDGVGTDIWYVFAPASQKLDLKFSFGFGIQQGALIYLDSYIVSDTWIFTDTKVFCDLKAQPAVEPGLADRFQHIDDFSVTPKLAETFRLEDFQFNEVYNISLIADSMIDGIDIIDYKGALEAAKRQLLARRYA